MGGSDGEIRINTKIDTSGLSSGIDNAKAKIKTWEQSVADLQAAFAGLADKIPELAKRAAETSLIDSTKTKAELDKDADAWNEWAEKVAAARGASKSSSLATDVIAREQAQKQEQQPAPQMTQGAQAIDNLAERVSALKALEKESMLLSPEQADAALSKVAESIKKVNEELFAARQAGQGKEMKAHLSAAEKEYANLQKNMSSVQGKSVMDAGTAEDMKTLSALNSKIESTQAKLRVEIDPEAEAQLNAKLDALVKKAEMVGKDVSTGAQTATPIQVESEPVKQELDAVQEKYRAVTQEAQALSTANQSVATSNQTVASSGQNVATSNQNVATASQSAANANRQAASANQQVASSANTAANSQSNMAQKTNEVGSKANSSKKHVNLFSAAMGKIKQAASNAGQKLAGAKKGVENISASLKGGLKTVIKYAFGVRSMFFLFKRLRKYVTEGFKDMAKQFPEFNASMSTITNAFSKLKNGLASAIAPLVTYLAPYIKMVADMLSGALSKVGEFFAAITGQDTFYRAVDVQKDYAESLEGTGEAAKDAAGQLMGFDKLNVINSNSGSGAGSGSDNEIKYEAVAVSGEMKSMTEKVKGFIKDIIKEVKPFIEEFKKIGTMFKDLVVRNLPKVKKLIKPILNLAQKLIKAVSKFLGNVLPLLDPIIDAVIGLFENAIEFFGQLIDAAEPVFEKIAELVAPIITSFINGISNIFKKLNESGVISGLGEALTAMLENASPFFEAVGDIIDLVFDLVADALPVVISFANQILPTIGTLVGAIGTSIKNTNPLVKAIGRVLTKIAGVVLPIVAEIINAIVETVSTITNFFSAMFDFSGLDGVKDDVSALNEEQKALVENVNETKKAWDAAKQAADAQAGAADAQAQREHDLWLELQNITDENGNIKQGYEERAQVISTELAEALGIEIEIVEGQIQNYKDLGKEIDAIIEKKRAEAYLTAYQDMYTEAVKNSQTAEENYLKTKSELGVEENRQKTLKEEYISLWNEFVGLVKKGNDLTEEEAERYRVVSQRMNELGGYTANLQDVEEDWQAAMATSQKLENGRLPLIAENSRRINELSESVETAGQVYGDTQRVISNYTALMTASATGSAQDMSDAMYYLKNNMITAETDINGSLERQTKDFMDAVNEQRQIAENGGGAAADALADNYAVAAWMSIQELKKVNPALANELEEALKTSAKNKQALAEAGKTAGSVYVSGFSAEMQALKDKAQTWGKDLCDNIAKGMNNNKAVVNNASIGVAKQIAQNLAYSEPKKGVLSKTHTWMPDMIKLLVSGIDSNAYKVENSVVSMAAQMKDGLLSGYASLSNVPFVSPVMSRGTVLPYATAMGVGKGLQQIQDSQSASLNKIGTMQNNNEEIALLRELITVVKGKNLTISPSATLGKVVNASTRLYQGVTG